MNKPYHLPQDFHYLNNLSLDHCEQIAELIKEENKHKPHMLEKSAQELYQEAYECGYGGIVKKNSIVGFYKFMLAGNIDTVPIYEAGSVMIHPEYRGKGLGKMLFYDIFQRNDPLFLVSNVASVIHICEELQQMIYPQHILPHKLKYIAELGGALLDSDVVCSNLSLNVLIND